MQACSKFPAGGVRRGNSNTREFKEVVIKSCLHDWEQALWFLHFGINVLRRSSISLHNPNLLSFLDVLITKK